MEQGGEVEGRKRRGLLRNEVREGVIVACPFLCYYVLLFAMLEFVSFLFAVSA